MKVIVYLAVCVFGLFMFSAGLQMIGDVWGLGAAWLSGWLGAVGLVVGMVWAIPIE